MHKGRITNPPKDSRPARSLSTVLRGLQFKWAVTLTLFMFALAFFGDLLIRRSIENIIFSQQVTTAHERCEALVGGQTMDSLVANDSKKLHKLAKRLEAEKSFLYVEFFSGGGVPLTPGRHEALNPPTIGRPPYDPPVAGLASSPKLYFSTDTAPAYLDIVHAVALRPQGKRSAAYNPAPRDLAGYVRVGIDLTSVQDNLAGFFLKFRYAGIALILVMIPLAFVIMHRVSAPINELSRVVTQLAKGDFRVRANINRRDELGQLADAFNSMADQLTTSNDRLVKLNAELEDRVLQRTRQLKDLSERDPLTGLYNRRHLNDFLVKRFAEAERYGSDMSCMMIDMDNFKHVNDDFGHEMGDTLLILTASVISSELREADMAARFGGDEFCVLLPQTAAAQAKKLGTRIVERFHEEMRTQLPDKELGCGLSVGVAGMLELHLVHPDELVKAADQALYNAKQGGKNRVRAAETLA